MAWNKELVHEAVERQRAYFQTGVTLPLKFRKEMLLRLKESVLKHQADMEKALHEDLGRSDGEAFLCDVGPVILEINEAIHGLRKWAKPERHYSGLLAFPSFTTRVYKIPYGVSLIISPFNFPFMLSLGVLTACIAAGNTAVMKASSKSKACTACLEKIIADAFPPEYCVVIDGGHDVADFCLEERFDKIFYTGSPKVGVHVMEMAAKNLTPVALELGGENGNWAIVRKDADIKDAARKIAFFKITNSGQICINVNQVAVAKEVADRFVEELKKEIVRQIGEKPLENPEYPHLIGSRAYQYCADEAKQYEDRIVFGGKGDPERYAFEPTLIYPVEETEPIANHELFCPLLPIVPFEDARIDELLAKIEKREHGLALYLFTKDIQWAKKVMSSAQYGGGCVNEVCIHLMVKGVPFNGTGHSGMGAYHGEWGFREFSHPSTVLFGKTRGNLPLREHPYTKEKKNLMKKFLK
ncbi:MAG: aldehyde dehydrogenase family protein [Bacilli bacterium]|nr:aldehyde dehydrogenase family protein [Bacilli bacterium]